MNEIEALIHYGPPSPADDWDRAYGTDEEEIEDLIEEDEEDVDE